MPCATTMGVFTHSRPNAAPLAERRVSLTTDQKQYVMFT